MAFDLNGAVSGAAGGASVGGVPGAIAGGVLGGFGTKKPKKPNYQPLFDTLNQSAATRSGIATGLTPKLGVANQQFGAGMKNLTSGFVSGQTGLGKDYVNAASDASGLLSRAQNAQFGSVLDRQRKATESSNRQALAQSGFNRGGALLAANAEQNQRLGEQAGDFASQVAQQSMASKTQALRDAFSADTDTLSRATGLDANTLETLLNNGREDLINEAHDLMQIEQQRANGIVDLQGQQLGANTAFNLAGAKNQNDLLAELLKSIPSIKAGLSKGGK